MRKKRNALSIFVYVSNDNGVTLNGSPIEITFRRNLPRLIEVLTP